MCNRTTVFVTSVQNEGSLAQITALVGWLGTRFTHDHSYQDCYITSNSQPCSDII